MPHARGLQGFSNGGCKFRNQTSVALPPWHSEEAYETLSVHLLQGWCEDENLQKTSD